MASFSWEICVLLLGRKGTIREPVLCLLSLRCLQLRVIDVPEGGLSGWQALTSLTSSFVQGNTSRRGPSWTSFQHRDAQSKDDFSSPFSSKGRIQANPSDQLAPIIDPPWAETCVQGSGGPPPVNYGSQGLVSSYVDGHAHYNHRARVREAFSRVSGGVGDATPRTHPAVLIQTMLTAHLLCAMKHPGHRGGWDEHHRQGLCPRGGFLGEGVEGRASIPT